MLLDDFAATWWQGVKDSVDSWDDAINLLKITFGPRKPAYLVYRELFANEQDSKTLSDVFICKARSLLAQLPTGTLNESIQLDMVYGLLQKRIRERVPRNKVLTFNDLLKHCREIEETYSEHFSEHFEVKRDSDRVNDKRPKCKFCKYLRV